MPPRGGLGDSMILIQDHKIYTVLIYLTWIYLTSNTAEINMRNASQSAAYGLYVGLGNPNNGSNN